jgi:hypothetical protein
MQMAFETVSGSVGVRIDQFVYYVEVRPGRSVQERALGLYGQIARSDVELYGRFHHEPAERSVAIAAV